MNRVPPQSIATTLIPIDAIFKALPLHSTEKNLDVVGVQLSSRQQLQWLGLPHPPSKFG
jgi:hypothetical protein